MTEPPELTFRSLEFGQPSQPGDISLCFSGTPDDVRRAAAALKAIRGLEVTPEGDTLRVTHPFPISPDNAGSLDLPLMRSNAKHCLRTCCDVVNCHIPIEAVPAIAALKDGQFISYVALRFQPVADAPAVSAETDYAALSIVNEQLEYMDEQLSELGLKKHKIEAQPDPDTGRYMKVRLNLDAAEPHPGKAVATVQASDLAAAISDMLDIPIAGQGQHR